MYPINNATPERIAIGQVILIADGTIQTAGVVITVRGQGGAEATGAGTTAYGAEGTVYYTPTQVETNYTSFVVIASKASCLSVSQTVVTTASSIAGTVKHAGTINTLDALDTALDAQHTITQDLVGNISTGSAAISKRAETGVVNVGTVIGGTTYTNTYTLDKVYHSIADLVGNMDVEYGFDVNGNGVAVEVVMDGYFSGNGDELTIQAYNFVGSVWESIGVLIAASSTDNTKATFNLDVQHTGISGVDLGIVKVRGYEAAAGLSSVQLNMDRVFISYSVVAQSVGYSNGRIWLNTINGVAGTELHVNGAADNKVLTLVDAITINNSLHLDAFNCSPDSSITFLESHTDEIWEGQGWSLALGGQNISKSHIHHCNNITGIATSVTGECHILDSHVGAVTIGEAHITNSSFSATFTAGAAGNYHLDNCRSGVSGAGNPTLTFSTLGAPTTLDARGWMGGATWVFDLNCTASIEVLLGGSHTITTGGADVEFRGNPKALSVTTSGTGIINIKADSAFPITIIGTGGIVNIYGAYGGITDTSTGTTVNAFGADITQLTDIKAKTDQLTFTVANELNGNMKSVNDEELIGIGSAADKIRTVNT